MIEYSPFGTITHREGTTDTPFLYAGQFGIQTEANGLLYMRARYYSPELRRFINADPTGFGGGLNWYAYANNSPLMYVDANGEIPILAMVAGGAINVAIGWGMSQVTGTEYNLSDAALDFLVGAAFGGFARAAAPVRAGLWTNRFPGVQVRQIGNYWVKQVNPSANRLMQSWGRMTIRRQASSLQRLRSAGSPAANFRLSGSGNRIITENVGRPLSNWNYLNPRYWGSRIRDSRAMGSFVNDLRPGNYGAGFRAFDPALDPISTGIASGFTGYMGYRVDNWTGGRISSGIQSFSSAVFSGGLK